MKPTTIALPLAVAALAGIALAATDAPPPPSPVSFSKKMITDTFFAEGCTVADVNGDGTDDLVAGPFWYAGPSFDTKHEIYEAKPYDPKGYSENFLTFTHDVNGDGHPDVVVFGFPGQEVLWYQHPGTDKLDSHWQRHVAVPIADNESPAFQDLTGDGSPEIICSLDGRFAYASIPEDPTQEWPLVFISDQATGGKFTHGLGVGDVNGDGRPDIIDKDSWWEQPESLEDAPLWKRHRYTFAPGGARGGAQMFAYDFDGDGDNDILTSIDSHGFGLSWFEQFEDADGTRSFRQHTIVGDKPEDSPFGLVFTQMHAIAMADVDGDGVEDIVTGKRYWAHGGNDPGGNDPAVLYWFRTVRGDGTSGTASFHPYQIDDDSGVGTQVRAEDISGDDKPDILVSNKKGTFVFTQE
ncbi:hypothetical protein BH23VER1_BH23VER1_08760 [soil metagenome]